MASVCFDLQTFGLKSRRKLLRGLAKGRPGKQDSLRAALGADETGLRLEVLPFRAAFQAKGFKGLSSATVDARRQPARVLFL